MLPWLGENEKTSKKIEFKEEEKLHSTDEEKKQQETRRVKIGEGVIVEIRVFRT